MSPIQVVPKKGGMTVVRNEKNELITQRTVTGWRVCIDYRKLNDAIRKDHFPLPFIDQMLERLAGHDYYCFLDGFLGYFQIPIAPEDQEKTTFTCPYGTFVYRRLAFGLCNAPATFQRCMTAFLSVRFSTSYHSQMSGQVENTNHALKWILEKTVGSNLKNWSKKLNDALWAFRTAFKTPISSTPFRMVYGKACHLPVEIKHKAFWALKLCNMDLSKAGVERNNQVNELEELRLQAYKTSKTYKERTKKWHDNLLKENKEFQISDRVLIFNSILKLFPGKLRSRWSGPFMLKQAYLYGTIKLFNRDGTSFKVIFDEKKLGSS
ncbi:reverse transcriptase domain-containing protein [Tanacetum coccineum]